MAQFVTIVLISDVIMTKKRIANSVIIGHALLVGVSFTLTGCSRLIRWFSSDQVPLSYVGTVSFGTPTNEQRGIIVPLSFAGGDWGKNSGLCFYRAKAHISHTNIDMTVTIALCPESGAAPSKQVVLAGVSPGSYAVFYRDPNGTRHEIGRIKIQNPDH